MMRYNVSNRSSRVYIQETFEKKARLSQSQSHLGNHHHPVKVGNCRDSRKRIDALIEEHVERTPQANPSKIVIEAGKDLVGEFSHAMIVILINFFRWKNLSPVLIVARS